MIHAKPNSAGLICIALMALALGCAGEPRPVARQPEDAPPAFDLAAQRLHDITGSLLLFHGAYGRMPTTLQELRLATGLAPHATIDPATEKPFAFSQEGFASSAGGRRLYVLAAPTPQRRTCLGVAITTTPGAKTGQIEVLPADALDKMTKPTSGEP
jgi:hypothetical protein